MMKFKDISELENIFVQKLSEKYKLSERDLKKAFIRFDTDKNGLLDLNELKLAVMSFVNGANEDQVEELMRAYDRNGDGLISYDEFIYAINTRKWSRRYLKNQQNSEQISIESPRPENYQKETKANKSRDLKLQIDDFGNEDRSSQASDNYSIAPSEVSYVSDSLSNPPPSRIDPFDLSQMEAKVNQFLKLFYDFMMSIARQLAFPRKSKDSSRSSFDNIFGSEKVVTGIDRLQFSHSELIMKLTRDLILKAFQKYTGYGEGRARSSSRGVEFSDFARVFRNLRIPGIQSIQIEVLEYIFEACLNPISELDDDQAIATANIETLADLVMTFGSPMDQKAVHKGALGAWNPVKDEHAKNFPLTGSHGVEVQSPSRRFGRTGARQQESNQTTEMATSIPLKFISHKSKTSLVAPTGFDRESSVKFSAMKPEYECNREFLYGMSSSLQSGSSFQILPSTLPSYRLANLSISSGSGSPPLILFYPSAAVGVLHDLSSHRQLFLEGQRDDITSFAMSKERGTNASSNSVTGGSNSAASIASSSDHIVNGPQSYLLATGCCGKVPQILLWRYEYSGQLISPVSSTSSSIPCLGRIDYSQFQRSVSALCFSADGSYLAAIGGDDHHSMVLFDVSSVWRSPSPSSNFLECPTLKCPVVAEATCQNGLPPMIKQILWSKNLEYTEFISGEHAGLCDVFVTVGEKHFRIWSLKRPSPDCPTASLKFRSPTLGKFADSNSNSLAKTYSCAAFVPCPANQLPSVSDVVVGSLQGYVYLFRRGQCVASHAAVRGGVTAVQSLDSGDRIVVAGKRGMVKILDGRSLNLLATFDLGNSLYPLPSSKSMPSNSQSIVARPSSAPRPRPSSSSSSSSSSVASSVTSSNRNRGVGDSSKSGPALSEDVSSLTITGLALLPSLARSASNPSSNSMASNTAITALVTLTSGVMIRVDLSNRHSRPSSSSGSGSGNGGSSSSRSSNGGEPSSAWMTPSEKSSQPQVLPVVPMFYYHTGTIWGMSSDHGRISHGMSSSFLPMRIAATCGDDRRLCVWDTSNKKLLTRTMLEAAGKCCHIDKTNIFVAVGCCAGNINVFALTSRSSPTSSSLSSRSRSNSSMVSWKLSLQAFRRDSTEDINDIKFSPDGGKIAAGSRDNCIYLYGCQLSLEEGSKTPQCILQPLSRLKKHSSYLRQLDWSVDGAFLRSVCGAHELLCWRVDTASLCTDINISDLKWRTHHCIFGFDVMGIWPPNADGTDINAVDVSGEHSLVATADDFGYVNLHNYPCVVKSAPKLVCPGHASHVFGVRFLPGMNSLLSIGGKDASVMQWNIRKIDRPLKTLQSSDYENIL